MQPVKAIGLLHFENVTDICMLKAETYTVLKSCDTLVRPWYMVTCTGGALLCCHWVRLFHQALELESSSNAGNNFL